MSSVDDRVKAAVAIAVAGDWRNLLAYEGFPACGPAVTSDNILHYASAADDAGGLCSLTPHSNA